MRPLHKLKSNEQGYLLLETLITATIFLTLFPVVILKTMTIYENQQLKQFIQTLDETLYEAQLTALTEKRYVYVQFNNSSHEVYAYYSMTDRFQTITAPSYVHFEKGSLSLVIRFSPQGTISQAGTLFITSNQTTYKLTLLLGQGRFYVEKQ